MADTTEAAVSANAVDKNRHYNIVTRPGWALVALFGLVLAIVGAFWQDPDPVADHGSAGAGPIDRILYPVERNPMQRLAKPLGYMTAVHMDDDGQDVWVVGRGGSMMHSKDGGRKWDPIDSHSESDLVDVRFVEGKGGQSAASRVGWAVGLRGEILTYRDRDAGWTKVEPKDAKGPLDPGDLFSIFTLRDGEKIWLLGNSGKLLHSPDAGGTWAMQDLQLQRDAPAKSEEQAPNARSVFFRKTNETGRVTGWVVGRGTILRTVDGGASWVRPQGIKWPAADESHDAKDSFADTELDTVQFDESKAGVPDNQLEGWITTRKGGLLHTRDGGINWEFERIDDTRKATAVPSTGSPGKRKRLDLRGMVIRGDRQWLTAADGSIWYRDERQGPWQFASTPTQTALRDITMDKSGKTGFAVGADGVILRTVDGGKVWADCTQGASAVMLAAHASPDGRKLWVAGHAGLMLATADAGKTWRRQVVQDRNDTKPDLYGVTFLPQEQTGWAISGRGHVYLTEDAGQHWALHSSDMDGERLRSIHVDSTSRRLWVSGEKAAIWTSGDNGATWVRQKTAIAKTVTLQRVLFADAERGWAVGSKGTLIETVNGGSKWVPVEVPKPKAMKGADPPLLRDIHFDPATNRLWIVGDGGTILRRSLGPRSTDEERDLSEARTRPSRWREPTGLPTASLLALRFDPSGRIGWAAGEGGVMVRTTDSGDTWARARKAPGSARTALTMSSDGQSGWAVGYPDALARTDDGGNEWEMAPWPLSYARFPAPWFWLVMVLLVGVVWRALSPLNEKALPGAEAMGVTDAPTETSGRDRLNFTPLAKGISRFLRNTHTEPPLTLAISGDWGTGKSSLMAMVCTDLRRYGSRPVWFNAWHHQSEEQMLAALLTGIREHGLPSMFSMDGCVFRLRLFWVRSRKNYAVTLLVLLAVSMFVGYLYFKEPTEWSRLALHLNNLAGQLGRVSGDAKLAAAAKSSELSPDDLGVLLPQLIALLGGTLALRKSLTAFGADPAVLARSTATQFKLRDASLQTGFRAQYAREFREVTAALPYRLVVVIDDLDRCKPEAVQNVMEAVNFLVSSGQCFVLFGMSTPRVEAALALAFTSIAKELADSDNAGDTDTSPEDRDLAERQRRFNYVRDYLQKLVNLEITLPSEVNMEDKPESLLLRSDPPAQPTSSAQALWDQLLSWWPIWLGIVVVAAGFRLGVQFASGTDEPSKVADIAVVAEKTPDKVSKIEPLRASEPSTLVDRAKRTAPPSSAINIRRDMPKLDADSATPPALLLACGFLLIAGAVVAIVVYRARTSHRQVEDTKEFKEALRVWLPLVMHKRVTRRATPRLIKRFGNRLRYLAMLQHDSSFDDTLLDDLQTRWRRLTGRAKGADKQAAQAPKPVLSEHLTVALGALHAVYGDDWRQALERLSTSSDSRPPAEPAVEPAATGRLADEGLMAETQRVLHDYCTAMRKLEADAAATRKALGAAGEAVGQPSSSFHWPPDAKEVKQFAQNLKGVRASAAASARAQTSASATPATDPGLTPPANAATA